MDRERLPVEFASLQELADKFAISDDVERDRTMQAASIEELQQLIDTVSPLFDEINGYLDTHDDDAACLLGSLAEATCEAQLDVGRRGNR